MSDTELETEATHQASDLEVDQAPVDDAVDALSDQDAADAASDDAADTASDDAAGADPDGSDADAHAGDAGASHADDQAEDAGADGSDADADAGDAGASHADDQGDDPDPDGSDAGADESDLDDLLGLAGADTDADAAPADSGDEQPEDATGEDVADAGDDDDADDDEQSVVRRRPESIEDVQDRRDLIRLAGDWFVVHTYSGYEKKVQQNLANRAESLAGGDRIFETVIPTEEVTEFKKGKKNVVQKKFLPGYVLVRMELDDESWNLVRHTPAVTGFVGASANKPVPLSLREVAATLSIPDRIEEVDEDEEATAQEAARAAVTETDLEVGETVRVTDGPFADFEGTIDEINLDQARLRLMMNVFGRETPLEIQFDKVAKIT